MSDAAPDPREVCFVDDLDALLGLSARLLEAIAADSWTGLLACPLLSGHDEQEMGLAPREQVLEEHLPSIRSISERFVTRLSDRTELLPVARVRRPDRRAIRRLAGHTEDWAGRGMTGPIPRRALARIRIENADLYENRMVSELIHPIVNVDLHARLRRLRRMQAELGAIARAADEGTHQRRRRLYDFWGGEVGKVADSAHRVTSTMQRLEILAAGIRRLRSSTLLQTLGGRTTGVRGLKLTNVIADDRRYRAAGLVWREYERRIEGHDEEVDREEQMRNCRRVFAHYVLGLVVRALDGLGVEPERDRLPTVGGVIALTGGWAPAALQIDADGAIHIECAGVTTRIDPVLDLVAPTDDDRAVLERWRQVSGHAAHTVLAYLAPAERVARIEGPEAAAMMSGGPDGPTGRNAMSAVPVSPMESASLERLSRIVARAVLEPPLLAYPPALTLADRPIPARLLEVLGSVPRQPNLSQLFHSPEPRSLHLRRPPSTNEWVSIDRTIDGLAARTNGTGWERDYRREIGLLRGALESATAVLERLLLCPLCGQSAPSRAVERSDDVFTVTCRGCGCSWGQERCGACGERNPVLEPSQSLLNPQISGAGWVERVFGRDALTSPCWARTNVHRYVCGACGACATPGVEAKQCVRCRKL